MEDLTKKKCEPCERNEDPLKKDRIELYLKQTSDWNLIENRAISREFKYKNFKEAIGFVNKVAELAESEGHHPDIFLHDYNQVKIILSTHSIGGLSENDFIEAAKIDKLYE